MRRSWLFVCLLCGAAAAIAGEPVLKSGDSVVFLGDSITANSKASGYVNLVVAGLKTNGIEIKAINSGSSGASSADLLKRTDAQLGRKPKPALLLVSCGINDGKGYGNAIPVASFQTNLTAIVGKAQAAGVPVLLLTTTALECHRPADRGLKKQMDGRNAMLVPYNAYVRQLAEQQKCLLADINPDFQKALAAPAGAGGPLTENDGVHPALAGNAIMARVVLATLGLNPPQLARAEESWRAIAEAEAKPGDAPAKGK